VKKSRAHALGQHFLSHPGLLDKIVRVIDPQPDELIIEVGPGRGALTALLAQKAGRVIGVEKDDRLIALLKGRNLPRTSIVHGDILREDWARLVKGSGSAPGKAKLAGNIPYAISSPLLARVLEMKDLFSLCVFLLQKEFAERLASGPGSKKYAPLSMLMQRAFVVKQRFTVSRQAFVPPPKVESAIVSLTPREKQDFPVDDEALLAIFLRAAFAQRRKTLANNLESAGLPREAVAAAVEAGCLPAKVRAEQVPVAEFTALFARLEAALPLAVLLAGKAGDRPGDDAS
jgi:16S rRNA (adenine1518-N6/adenine1519-N6)-dimethyltransferase